MLEAVRIDIAAAITGISLVIGSVATLIVALRDRKQNGNSTDKAISVTKINDTEGKVEILIQQVDFLFEEISRLRKEKDTLTKKVEKLTEDLRQEKNEHAKTREALAKALTELAEKTERLLALEQQLLEKK